MASRDGGLFFFLEEQGLKAMDLASTKDVIEKELKTLLDTEDKVSQLRTQLKSLTTVVKKTTDNLIVAMEKAGCNTIATPKFSISINDRSRLPGITTNHMAVWLKEYFHMTDPNIDSFLEWVDERRRDGSKVTRLLTKKKNKDNKDQPPQQQLQLPPAVLVGGGGGGGASSSYEQSSMASTASHIYD